MTETGKPIGASIRARVSTGYGRLDEALNGGFVTGSAVVLAAPTGNEVPLLIGNFLRAAQNPALLVCRTLSSSQIITNERVRNVKSLVCSDKHVSPASSVIPGRGIGNLTDLNIQINEAIASTQPRRVGLDILSDVLLRHKALQTRKWLTELLEKLRSKSITTLATINPHMHGGEEVQAVTGLFDGSLEIVDGKPTNLMQIKWMHGLEIVQKEVSLADLRSSDIAEPTQEQRIFAPLAGRTGRMPTSGGEVRTESVVLGTVTSLLRYPVKSMMGEELNAAQLTEQGLLGDRVYALFDQSTGKIASAKNPLKWAKLFDFHAAFIEPPLLGSPMPPVRITLPDGSSVTSSQAELESMLSKVFGREVRFAAAALEKASFEEYWPDMEGLAYRETVTDEAMPPNSFFDFGIVHLVTTSTLNRLRELYPQGRFEVRRFRPNIVIETASSANAFVENEWIGRTLSIGEQARLKVIAPCPRCVMTTLAQADLPKDPGILRTVALHTPRIEAEGFGVLSANVGIYADVLGGGTIRRGDLLRME